MKKIVKILLLFLPLYSNAQSPVINIKNQDGFPITDAYYKDIDQVLNPFEGTYLYTNGTTFLKVVLEKKIMSFDGFKYSDLLIGEYQYVENGIEKINTLYLLSSFYSENQHRHSIHGNFPLTIGDEICVGCTVNEFRILSSLVELSTDNLAQIIISKTLVNGHDAIKLNIWWQLRTKKENEPPLPQASLPGGDWVLLKQ